VSKGTFGLLLTLFSLIGACEQNYLPVNTHFVFFLANPSFSYADYRKAVVDSGQQI
jgi:hypothetical protein